MHVHAHIHRCAHSRTHTDAHTRAHTHIHLAAAPHMSHHTCCIMRVAPHMQHHTCCTIHAAPHMLHHTCCTRPYLLCHAPPQTATCAAPACSATMRPPTPGGWAGTTPSTRAPSWISPRRCCGPARPSRRPWGTQCRCACARVAAVQCVRALHGVRVLRCACVQGGGDAGGCAPLAAAHIAGESACLHVQGGKVRVSVWPVARP